MWDDEAIKNHKRAAKEICAVKEETIKFIKKYPYCTEYDVVNYILYRFQMHGLQTDSSPMVAFRENTNRIHYEAELGKSKTLHKNSLIMLDLWAGLRSENAPYADITWMIYYGEKIPSDLKTIFSIVRRSQLAALKHIKENLLKKKLPKGSEINNLVGAFFKQNGSSKFRVNYSGHSLGYTSSHGKLGTLNYDNNEKLKKNVAYTLEPEFNIPKKMGVRLELDFYISEGYKLIITTDAQKKITFIDSK